LDSGYWIVDHGYWRFDVIYGILYIVDWIRGILYLILDIGGYILYIG